MHSKDERRRNQNSDRDKAGRVGQDLSTIWMWELNGKNEEKKNSKPLIPANGLKDSAQERRGRISPYS